MYGLIEYPTGISKSNWNSKRRRNGRNWGKTWKVFGYTIDGVFRSEPFKTVFGIKPAITLFKRRFGNCFHCGRKVMQFDKIERLGFLKQRPEIICPKCQMESP